MNQIKDKEKGKRLSPHEHWGQRVLLVLSHQGRKLTWLSRGTGVNMPQLSGILHGDPRYIAGREIDMDLIHRIAERTGVPEDYFLREDN